MHIKKIHKSPKNINRVDAPYNKGLSRLQVKERMTMGAHNTHPKSLTRSVGRIISDNLFTLFNMVNVVLASFIIAVGSYKNLLFMGVVISNTTIGIFQEIRAKLNIDKLSIITQSKITVVREGNEISIPQEHVVLDDIMHIGLGNQICSDGEVVYTKGLEVDESQLTGEADPVEKTIGSAVLSGSYVVAGDAYVRVIAVGSENYAAKLSLEAKREKHPKSELMSSLNKIIKFMSITIIPVGLALFTKNYFMSGHNINDAVLAATAAMLGMIPEGLMLLTSIAFAVSAVNLSRHNTLVQSMPCIETLARVDVLCLDKTGTITDGSLSANKIIPCGGFDDKACMRAVSSVIYSLSDDNATSRALKAFFSVELKTEKELLYSMPFSSSRKYSGCSFKDYGTLILGAPEFMLSHLPHDIKEKADDYLQEGHRVIGIAHSPDSINESKLPEGLKLMALIVISDNIRPDAENTFDYFNKQGVALKVISGDNPVAVSSIAKRVGLEGAEKYIDMSQLPEDADYAEICENYTVFGRVSPYQKRFLVRGFQKNGHTVAMTGDGVNDVLALREADCSVAMAAGSDAARCISDFVLLNSNFNAMTYVVAEGRRVINNIESVASLFLIKTIYSTILAVLFLCLPLIYPFQPIQFSPVSTLTVGIPSFLLALRPNFGKIKKRFISNVLENALPAALLVVFNILTVQTVDYFMKLSFAQTSTLCIMLTGVSGFILLTKVSRPLDIQRKVMLCLLGTVYVNIFIFFYEFFNFVNPFSIIAVVYVPMMIIAPFMYSIIGKLVMNVRECIEFRKAKPVQ